MSCNGRSRRRNREVDVVAGVGDLEVVEAAPLNTVMWWFLSCSWIRRPQTRAYRIASGNHLRHIYVPQINAYQEQVVVVRHGVKSWMSVTYPSTAKESTLV